jgi:D-glycero-D-manno-heptose 1,7-bisphosphate phosphatase
MKMHPALFLDRDGVIIENRPDYVRSWSDVVIFPHALDAMARLNSSPSKIIIVTNQSAVGRGLIPLSDAYEINTRLIAQIERAGGRVDGVWMCPHAPEDECDCRKPRPGLLLQAAATHSIDLNHSILIGDALSDLEAGRSAGIPLNILVRTGRGADQEKLASPFLLNKSNTYDNLADALDHLIQRRALLLDGYSGQDR